MHIFKLEKYKMPMEILLHLIVSGVLTYCLFAFLPTLLIQYKISVSIIFLIIIMLDFVFLKYGKNGLLKFNRKILIVVSSFIVISTLVFYVSEVIVLAEIKGIENVLKENESVSKVIFFFICFAHPVVLPLPEAVTISSGSAVFGPLVAGIISFLGTISGIIVMYFLSRFGGHKITSKFIKEKQLRKFKEYVGRNETFILIVLFILPIMPDEIICVGSGISGVRFKKFLIIAVISKLISSSLFAFSVYLTDLFSITNSQLVLICTSSLGGIYIVSSIIKKRLNRKKVREESFTN